MSMGKDLKTGEVEAIEINTGQIPGQMSMTDIPGAVTEQKAYDPDTGEIYDQPESNSNERTIIDMRKKA